MTFKHTACSIAQPCATLCDPRTVACQAPLSMGFSRQEYWSGLPFLPPDNLPDSGIEPVSLALPALTGGFFTNEPAGKPIEVHHAFVKDGYCSSL